MSFFYAVNVLNFGLSNVGAEENGFLQICQAIIVERFSNIIRSPRYPCFEVLFPALFQLLNEIISSIPRPDVSAWPQISSLDRWFCVPGSQIVVTRETFLAGTMSGLFEEGKVSFLKETFIVPDGSLFDQAYKALCSKTVDPKFLYFGPMGQESIRETTTAVKVVLGTFILFHCRAEATVSKQFPEIPVFQFTQVALLEEILRPNSQDISDTNPPPYPYVLMGDSRAGCAPSTPSTPLLSAAVPKSAVAAGETPAHIESCGGLSFKVVNCGGAGSCFFHVLASWLPHTKFDPRKQAECRQFLAKGWLKDIGLALRWSQEKFHGQQVILSFINFMISELDFALSQPTIDQAVAGRLKRNIIRSAELIHWFEITRNELPVITTNAVKQAFSDLANCITKLNAENVDDVAYGGVVHKRNLLALYVARANLSFFAFRGKAKDIHFSDRFIEDSLHADQKKDLNNNPFYRQIGSAIASPTPENIASTCSSGYRLNLAVVEAVLQSCPDDGKKRELMARVSRIKSYPDSFSPEDRSSELRKIAREMNIPLPWYGFSDDEFHNSLDSVLFGRDAPVSFSVISRTFQGSGWRNDSRMRLGRTVLHVTDTILNDTGWGGDLELASTARTFGIPVLFMSRDEQNGWCLAIPLLDSSQVLTVSFSSEMMIPVVPNEDLSNYPWNPELFSILDEACKIVDFEIENDFKEVLEPGVLFEYDEEGRRVPSTYSYILGLFGDIESMNGFLVNVQGQLRAKYAEFLQFCCRERGCACFYHQNGHWFRAELQD
jgi:hypothetical protein